MQLNLIFNKLCLLLIIKQFQIFYVNFFIQGSCDVWYPILIELMNFTYKLNKFPAKIFGWVVNQVFYTPEIQIGVILNFFFEKTKLLKQILLKLALLLLALVAQLFQL